MIDPATLPTEMVEPIVIAPQPGPQSEFAACGADIVFYGGAAGGGKSWALRFEVLRGIHLKGYTAVIFRRTSPELTAPGGMWEQSKELYYTAGGTPREHPRLDWTWPSGARVKFGHLQHEKDKLTHQGPEYAYVGFDEVDHFTESQFWYLFSRNRSTCGIDPYMRGTCNPNPDSWVRKLIDWWIGKDGLVIAGRSGVIRYFIREVDELKWADNPEDLIQEQMINGVEPDDIFQPKSFTFIEAGLEDNPILTEKDPGYKSRLQALSRVERERLLGRNWNIRPAAGLIFREEWSQPLPTVPRNIMFVVRAWDFAATKPKAKGKGGRGSTDPDWTVGVKLGALKDGRFVILDVKRARLSPLGVEKLVRRTAKQDGVEVQVGLWQDPGQAGVSQIDHFLRKVLRGYTVKTVVASQAKQVYWDPVSAAMENGLVDHVENLPNPFWSCLEEAPEGKHDDDADALALAFMLAKKKPVYDGYQSAPPDRSHLEL